MRIETGNNFQPREGVDAKTIGQPRQSVLIPVDYRDNGLTKGEAVVKACQGRKSDVFEKPMQMGDIPRVFFPGHNEATV